MRRLQYKIKVGITMGDPSGIGPEIIAKAIPALSGLAEFLIIGDRWVFEKKQKTKYKIQKLRFEDLKNVRGANFKFGEARAEYGRASIEYLDKALELIKKEKIDCLVTAPLSKEAINKAGFNFPGHTEYLAKRTHTKGFAMMLLSGKLKISLATRHIPLAKVPQELNEDKIYKTALLTYSSLQRLFLIKDPRIVVCGLNPHASDNGLIGREEDTIIKPALEKLRTIIKHLDGPVSADAAIFKANLKEYDCALAMYHDQALIPLKLSGFEAGVNLTLGLPFIRTSPLHGTAFDIAGKNLASCLSLAEAVKLAVRCAINQRKTSYARR